MYNKQDKCAAHYFLSFLYFNFSVVRVFHSPFYLKFFSIFSQSTTNIFFFFWVSYSSIYSILSFILPEYLLLGLSVICSPQNSCQLNHSVVFSDTEFLQSKISLYYSQSQNSCNVKQSVLFVVNYSANSYKLIQELRYPQSVVSCQFFYTFLFQEKSTQSSYNWTLYFLCCCFNSSFQSF